MPAARGALVRQTLVFAPWLVAVGEPGRGPAPWWDRLLRVTARAKAGELRS